MPVACQRLEFLQLLKLLQSVHNEDIQQIEKLILNGVPDLINLSEPENGETGLHIAACKNNENMICLLLDLGASPNVCDLKGHTPAMRAAEFGHVQALSLLTDAGSDMTIMDKEGKGILFYCIQPTKRHSECLRLCLRNGANVNNVSTQGETLLTEAAVNGLDNVVKELLGSGTDPDSKNTKTGRSALHFAAESGSAGCARHILEAGCDHNTVDNQNIHAAHLAALKGHFDIIRLLAAYGSDVGKVALDGNTPMHHAAAEGHGPMVKFLGQRGCPTNLKNKEGNTPRALAKENEHKEAMKECRKAEKLAVKLSKGGGKAGEPYAIRLYDWLQEHEEKVLGMFQQFAPGDDDGKLGYLSKENFVMCLQSLNCPVEAPDLDKIAANHDPSKEDKVDYALFLTCKKVVGKNFMVTLGKKKKKKGGKKGRKGKKGKTKIPLPICTAPDGPRSKNGGPPQDLLERYVHFTDNSRFNRDNPPAHPIQDDSAWYLNFPESSYLNINDAAKLGDLESLKAAFIKGTPVDQRDKYYKTPLMAACAHGNLDMAQFLLDLGAEVNGRDNFKWSPLHHACHSGQLEVIKLLLDRGAELDAQTINGGTPIMRAIESSREEAVEFLISKGAKIQLPNKKGHTALDIAKAYADPRVVAMVQKRWDEIPPPVDKKKRRPAPRPKSKAQSSKDGGDDGEPGDENDDDGGDDDD